MDLVQVNLKSINFLGTADIPPQDAVNFILKNERDYAQLHSSTFSKPNYSYSVPIQQHSFVQSYPNIIPQMDYQKPQEQFIPYQKPLVKNEVWQNPSQSSDSQTNPELQSLLSNLLSALKQEGSEKVLSTEKQTVSENLQFNDIPQNDDTSNSIPNSVLNILNSLNKK